MRNGILAVVALSALVLGGCDLHLTPRSKGIPSKPQIKPELVNDGEGGNLEGRERVGAFFQALGKAKSADEEKTVVINLANWLNANGCRVEVEQQDGEHRLACPHFPPVTPWTSHRFFDERNVDLLPVSTACLIDTDGVRYWLPKAETKFLSDVISADVDITAPVSLKPSYTVIIDGVDFALEPDELIWMVPDGTKRWNSPGVRQRILTAAGIK